ncbi:MAG: PIN domain nuclease [Cyclobacteriaceae bacterium]|nr:PIN domain nuclease [Cyclobacteriaceae bacterium]
MKKPLLVDTSVWICFFNGINCPETDLLSTYLEQDGPIYICPTILQEVLQGIRDDKQYAEVREYLLALPILNDDGVEMALSAAGLYRSLRKKGKTIRKSNDCLIAQYAIKHGLKVLHRDRDFDLLM